MQKNIIDDYKRDNKILYNNNCFINEENKIPFRYYEKIFYKYSRRIILLLLLMKLIIIL